MIHGHGARAASKEYRGTYSQDTPLGRGSKIPRQIQGITLFTHGRINYHLLRLRNTEPFDMYLAKPSTMFDFFEGLVDILQQLSLAFANGDSIVFGGKNLADYLGRAELLNV